MHKLAKDNKAYGDTGELVSDPNVDLVAVHIVAKELVGRGDFDDILQTMMLFTSPWFGATFPEAALYGTNIANGANLGGMTQADKNFFWETTGVKGTILIEGPMGNMLWFPPTIKFVKVESGSGMEAFEVPEAKEFSHNTGKAWEAFAGEPGEAQDFPVALTRHDMLDAIYKSIELGPREEDL
ncbi:hypothetical protein CORC01_13999 [Colletotrichum orchidophilum]|uniref:Uncharacterized protein n=1 Tax=Colletotrichum orchidophilum TaxID=1209926 RepID=A0A1G4ANR9_9PEZI|nr:uncharacterized protein CORC01_13999 [Colletotrichum orchidophilum]OHE90693.1 hypothetical protein CORC01_13999 [Colletotrichum orchidophilum]